MSLRVLTWKWHSWWCKNVVGAPHIQLQWPAELLHIRETYLQTFICSGVNSNLMQKYTEKVTVPLTNGKKWNLPSSSLFTSNVFWPITKCGHFSCQTASFTVQGCRLCFKQLGISTHDGRFQVGKNKQTYMYIYIYICKWYNYIHISLMLQSLLQAVLDWDLGT